MNTTSAVTAVVDHSGPWTRVIRPKRGFVALDFAELWRFRELLVFLVWRNILVRYKQTAIGVAWALVQPVLTMVVFTVVFGMLAKLPGDGRALRGADVRRSAAVAVLRKRSHRWQQLRGERGQHGAQGLLPSPVHPAERLPERQPRLRHLAGAAHRVDGLVRSAR